MCEYLGMIGRRNICFMKCVKFIIYYCYNVYN